MNKKTNSINELSNLEAAEVRYLQEIAKGRAKKAKLRKSARKECAHVIANVLAGTKKPLVQGTYTVQIVAKGEGEVVLVAVRSRAIRKSEKTEKPVSVNRKGS
jgi:hypothetical protein